jgi:hypothetical protein
VSIFVPYGLLSSAIYFFRRLFEGQPRDTEKVLA